MSVMSMMKIDLEPAYVLHAKPYRETSLLADIFTQHHGRITAIARSARGPRSRFKGCLVPFSPLLISCCGRGDLMTITAVEPFGASCFLQGDNLFKGFYLNELVIRLLQRYDPYTQLFSHYQQAITALQTSQQDTQISLRLFEKHLLVELGYGLTLGQDVARNQVQPDSFYYFEANRGLISAPPSENKALFKGSHLLAIANNQFTDERVLMAAKRLMRLALTALLGDAPLKCRAFFTAYKG